MPPQGLESLGLRPIRSASRMIVESTGIDRLAAAGVALERGEPVPDVLPIDPGDLAALEIRQDLVLQIGPVDGERSGFPDPLVAPEHDLRDPLEQRFLGIGGQALAAPDRGKHLARADTRLAGGHGFGCCRRSSRSAPPHTGSG